MATTTNLEPDRGWAIVTSTMSERMRSLARARRHTRLVRAMRGLLPVAAAGVVIAYVAVVLQTIGWVDGLPQIEISKIVPENLTMHNPRYEGFNDDGGSYVVTAKTAVQELTDLGRITLNDIVGDLLDANKQKTNLKAVHGFYNSKTSALELYDGIDIVSESGLKARLTRADVDTKKNVVVSNEPVVVEMPAGTIRSKAMTLHNKARKVLFRDSVTAHLVPKDQPQAPAAPAKGNAAAAPLISAANGPIDITSNQLEIDDTKKTATFSGSVRAAQADAVLETAALEVHYAGDAAKGAVASAEGAKIRRVVSTSPVVLTRAPQDRVTSNSLDFDAQQETTVLDGDVVMTSGAERRATGDRATIDQKADTVLLTGNVHAQQGRNELNGGRLFVERATGRTQLTNPAAAGAKEPGRITTRFYRNVADPNGAAKSGTDWTGATTAVGVFKTDPNAPIDVEADRLDVDDRAKLAVYKGSVRAAQGDFVVRTAALSAHYTGQAGLAADTSGGNGGQPAQLTRIEARGKVIVTSKNGQNATGDWADFDVKANQVIVGGDVVLTQEKNVVRGTRLVIDMTTGQSVVHNDPGASWTAKAAPASDKSKKGYVVQGPINGGRPSAIFYPKEKKGSAPAADKPTTEAPAASSDSWGSTEVAP